MPEPTKAAMRAAKEIARQVGDALKESLESQGWTVTEMNPCTDLSPMAQIIDREAGLSELVSALKDFRAMWGSPSARSTSKKAQMQRWRLLDRVDALLKENGQEIENG